MKLFIRKLIQKFKEGKWNIFPQIHFSQDGSDIFLSYYFRGRIGFYVDVGAYHPFRFSNTTMLYYRGWSGINIDARIGSKKLFDFWRSRDTNREIMVGSGEEVLYETHKDGAMNGRGERGRSVKTFPLSDIIPTYRTIDLLTIDAEGMDLEILQTNDWKNCRPEIIIVEVNKGGDFDKYMKSISYHLVAKTILNNIYKDNKKGFNDVLS